MGSATGIAGVELNVITQMLLHFMMAMLRIGAFAVAAPIFGARYVPLQVRIIAVVALTVPIWDRVPMPEFNALIEITIIITILQELIIGLAAGLILSIIFSAAAKAGDQIATSAGLGFASQIDPVSGTQTPVISQLFSLMFLVIFLSLDGHLVALRIILDSYEIVPIGAQLNMTSMIGAGLAAAGAMFLYSLQLMLPVVLILLIINTVIGVLTRSAPQLNIFSFGFPLTLILSLGIIYIALPILGDAMRLISERVLFDLAELMGGLADGGE